MAVNPLQSEDELKAHLEDHLSFIESSATAFDSGFEAEAKRLAVSIRVLVHDTRTSKSLLGQLGLIERTEFLDTTHPRDPENRLPYSGLIVQMVTPSGASHIAPLDDLPWSSRRASSFEEWWNGLLFVDSAGHEFSRKSIVLSLANQDGGAHVDPSLNAAYANLTRNNSLGLFYSASGANTPMAGPERAAVRQIAHELLKSLVPSYAPPKPSHAEASFFISAMSLKVAVPPPKHQTKIGRNEACPCGSNKKYKRCCGALV